jgi:Leucine-rich repeat (LRR) protein
MAECLRPWLRTSKILFISSFRWWSSSSWWCLMPLSALVVTHFTLIMLSDSFGQLPNLDTTNLSHCGQLQSLSVSMGGLTKLRLLNILYSGVQKLLDNFGELQSLGDFNASGWSSISRLPDWLGQLPNLDTMDLTGSSHLQTHLHLLVGWRSYHSWTDHI